MPSLINSDDGAVSGAAGIKTTGSNDGLLNLQSNGSTIVAITGSGISVTGTVTQTGVATFAAGTAAAPAITFTGDTNTGIYSPGADTIAFSEGGTEALRINSSAQVEFAAGASSTPSITFTGDTNTGIYSPGADTIAFAEGGTEALRINSSAQVEFTAGSASTPSVTFTGDTNTGIYSPGADRIGFAEGGAQVGEFDASSNFLFNSGYGSVAIAYGCRAWVNFNGVGTVSIRASGNVSTITDGGVGIYTVNFSNAMPDVNYATLGTVLFGAIGNKGGIEVDSTGSNPTTTTTRLRTYTGSAAQADCVAVYVSIFR